MGQSEPWRVMSLGTAKLYLRCVHCIANRLSNLIHDEGMTGDMHVK